MKSALTKRFGIEFPLFAFTHCRDVVVEVTNAGGFGVLGAVAHTPETLEIDLAWIDARIKGPYGVDLLIPSRMEDKDGAQRLLRRNNHLQLKSVAVEPGRTPRFMRTSARPPNFDPTGSWHLAVV